MLTFAECNSIAMVQILMSCSTETRTCSAQALHAQWFDLLLWICERRQYWPGSECNTFTLV